MRKSIMITIKRQKGLTLIELLLIIGFSAIIIAASLYGYIQTKDQSLANDEASRAIYTYNAIRSLFNAQPSYMGLNTDVAAQSKAMPEKNVVGGYDDYQGTVHFLGSDSRTNSAITLAPSNEQGQLATGNDRAANFRIQYENVFAGQCRRFVNIVYNTFDAIYISNSIGNPNNSQIVKQKNTALDTARMVQLCNQNEESNFITLVGD
jgi:type II secretory pathway pseudopilin PulG